MRALALAVLLPSASAPVRAPALAPGAALAPLAAAPLPAPAALTAPALAAAPAASAPAPAGSPAPAPRAALVRTAAAAPASAGAAFDGGPAGPEGGWAPAVGPIASRPAPRLKVLSASELGAGAADPGGPVAPAPEPEPFLYRHHRVLRFFAAPLLRLFYRVDVRGELPPGPVLIAPNHVSFLDPVLVCYAAGRPVRFLMARELYEARGLQWLYRALGAIPISPKDPKPVIEESLNRARRALAAGQTVGVFPEGMLTRDGGFGIFRRGFERVADGLPAPVVPAYVGGMWGSALSRHPGKGWGRSLLARLRGRRAVVVSFGGRLPRAEAGLAREAVARLAAAR